jgi:hypothetical protein
MHGRISARLPLAGEHSLDMLRSIAGQAPKGTTSGVIAVERFSRGCSPRARSLSARAGDVLQHRERLVRAAIPGERCERLLATCRRRPS